MFTTNSQRYVTVYRLKIGVHCRNVDERRWSWRRWERFSNKDERGSAKGVQPTLSGRRSYWLLSLLRSDRLLLPHNIFIPPQQGLHTQATNTLSHKHTVKSLGDSCRQSKTEEVKYIFGFQVVWNQFLGASAQHIFNIFPFSSMEIMYIVSNKESISSIGKGATVLLLTRKGCAKAWSPAWHCKQIYRVLFLPPPPLPLKISK